MATRLDISIIYARVNNSRRQPKSTASLDKRARNRIETGGGVMGNWSVRNSHEIAPIEKAKTVTLMEPCMVDDSIRSESVKNVIFKSAR